MKIRGIYKNTKQRWAQRGIGSKFTVAFIVFIILPVISIGLFILRYSSQNVEEQLKTLTTKMLEQMGRNLDNQLQTADRLALSIMTNEMILTDIQWYDRMAPLEKLNAEYRLHDWLLNFSEVNPDIAGLYLFDQQNNIFFAKGNPPEPGYSATESQWYQDTVAADGAMILFGTHDEFHVANHPRRVISICHSLRDFSSRKVLGVLMLDLPDEFLPGILEQPGGILERGADICVLDEGDRVIYDSASEEAPRMLPEELLGRISDSNGMMQYPIDGKDYFLIFYTSDYTGWRILNFQPYSSVLSSVIRARLLILGLVCGFVIIFIIWLIYIQEKLIMPIKSMSQAVAMVKAGNYDVVLDFPRHGEITTLSNGLIDMARHIRRLIQDVYMSELLQREAELMALQNQINPHFLYNTLECVRGMAIQSGNRDMALMVRALSFYTRYNLSRSTEFVTIEEELRQIENYMTIQNIRHNGKYRLEYDIPSQYAGFRIMKMIFQPLVENAIQHGLERKIGGGFVRLSLREDGCDLVFCITDDGIGMPEDKIHMLNEKLAVPAAVHAEFRKNTGGVGIENVNNRLRIHYGERSGLFYETVSTGGVCVTIRIPKNAKEGGLCVQ